MKPLIIPDKRALDRLVFQRSWRWIVLGTIIGACFGWWTTLRYDQRLLTLYLYSLRSAQMTMGTVLDQAQEVEALAKDALRREVRMQNWVWK